MNKYSAYIHTLYIELENKADLLPLSHKMLNDDTLSDKDKSILQKEWWILSDYALHCKTVECQEDIIAYGKERIASTSNVFLLTRYYHVLYNLTNNNEYCKNAIANYIIIFKQHVAHNETGIRHEIYRVLDWIIQLSRRIRLDLSSVKDLLISYLQSDLVSDEIKHRILVSIKGNYNKWKIKGIEFIPDLCLAMYSRTTKYGACYSILEIGEFFARRFRTDLLKIFYERMGDNEEKNIHDYDGNKENMIIPHYNQSTYLKMMSYYQQSGNKEKLRYATSKYNESKVGIRFLKFEEKRELPKEFIDYMEVLFEIIKVSKSEDIIFFLSNHCDLFFPSRLTLDKRWEDVDNDKPSYMEYMGAVRSDINNNITHTSHEEIWRFQMMDIFFRNSVKWISQILSLCIERKQLSYFILKRILLKYSNFGTQVTLYRNQNQLNYCLFDKIDYAIRDFFVQFKREMNGKCSDWRNTISTLSLQFEGILRDIIRLYNGETSRIVGSKKEDVAEMLLDDLLRTEACKELYSDEDRDLFTYAFTSKGLNIRNYVAHGFYLPSDYTAFKAILVLLCILRLVRYDQLGIKR